MLIAGLMMAAKGFAFPLKDNVQEMQMLLYGKVIDGNRGGVGTGIAAVITGRPGDAFAAAFGKKSHQVTDERAMKTVKKILEDPSHWLKLSDLEKIYLVALCSLNTLKCIEEKLIKRSREFLNLIARTMQGPAGINPRKPTRKDKYSDVFPANNGILRSSKIESEMSQWNGYSFYNFGEFIRLLNVKIVHPSSIDDCDAPHL